MVRQLTVQTRGQGLYEVTREVSDATRGSGIAEGLCTIFVRHTSASLVIQENADPSAKRDLERWIARLVPEGDPFYTHDSEGPDDMPAHIRAALTNTSLSIPIRRRNAGARRVAGGLSLGASAPRLAARAGVAHRRLSL